MSIVSYIMVLVILLIVISIWYKKRWIFTLVILIIGSVLPFLLINGDVVVQKLNQGFYSKPILYTRYNLFFDLLLFEIFLLIIYLIFYLPNDWIKWKDYKRKKNKVSFKKMSNLERKNILGDALICHSCNEDKLFIEDEIYKSGMHILVLKCLECNIITRKRLDV